MPFSPTPSSSSSPSVKAGAFGNRRVEIVTIPEKFYGVALNMDGKTQAEREAPPPPAPIAPPKPVPAAMVKPPERKSWWPYIALVSGVVLVVTLAFVYVNRDLLFQKTDPLPSPPPPKVIPNAPMNLSATSSGLAVSLTWVDGGGDETGVRIERQEAEASYLPLTVLPARSTAFLDVSVQPSRSYVYRVVAFGEAGDSGPSNEVSIRLPDPAPLPPPPPPTITLPPGGLDSDSDGLTDIEEPLYGTDARTPDADGDGFLDGNEVFHLYNPAAQSAVRLLDSGLVKLFSAPAGWSLLVPATWSAGLDIPDGSQATISNGSGDTFILRIEDNPTGASPTDWYMAKTPGETASSVRSFVTKGGLRGISVGDRLETLFSWGSKIFTFKYRLGGQTFINYRTSFEMMLNSLKLTGVPSVSSLDASTGPGFLTGVSSTSTSFVSSSTVPVISGASSTAAVSASQTTSTTLSSSTSTMGILSVSSTTP